MPAFTLATAPRGHAVHLVPAGAAQSWCGRRADHPVRGPIRLSAVCRRCWAAAPDAGQRTIQAAACPPERVG